jgi:hypothetical protein
METKDEMHTYAYGNVNITTQQITANVILLNGFDLSEFFKTIQDLKNDYDAKLQEMKLNYESRLSEVESLLTLSE